MARTRKAETKATIAICINTLRGICENADARDADRIAAAKLLIDVCGGKTDTDTELRVVLKDVPGEYVR